MDESLTVKYLSYSSPSGFFYNLKRRLVATKAASIDQCWMSIRTKRCTIATSPVNNSKEPRDNPCLLALPIEFAIVFGTVKLSPGSGSSTGGHLSAWWKE